MKKNYVNLNVQVVEVQLSDCIAGSTTAIEVGDQVNNAVDCANGTGAIEFRTW